MIDVYALERQREQLPEADPADRTRGRIRITEEGLFRAHAAELDDPDGMTLERTLPCACGGWITAVDRDPAIAAAVGAHQETTRHLIWRAWMADR